MFALWYGKGPGVDRAGDVLKHGNYAGTDPNGGVLVVAGDDHQGKSSTIAHHSQQALAANSIPVLYPADVGEFARFALLGWALSRYSGCWVGFKVVNETAEQAMTCRFDIDTFDVTLPDESVTGPLPPEGIHYRGAYAQVQDEILRRRYRLPRVAAFVRANGLDRLAMGSADAPLGIVTAGKCWHEVGWRCVRWGSRTIAASPSGRSAWCGPTSAPMRILRQGPRRVTRPGWGSQSGSGQVALPNKKCPVQSGCSPMRLATVPQVFESAASRPAVSAGLAATTS